MRRIHEACSICPAMLLAIPMAIAIVAPLNGGVIAELLAPLEWTSASRAHSQTAPDPRRPELPRGHRLHARRPSVRRGHTHAHAPRHPGRARRGAHEIELSSRGPVLRPE